LTAEREVYTHQEGGANDYEHKLPGRVKYTNVTLKRGIADDSLWKWFTTGLYDAKVKRRDISIILYNADRTKAKRWNLIEAFPTKWSGPDFNTDGAQVAVETLELTHHGMEVTNWARA
jgi:phage tail-like protein